MVSNRSAQPILLMISIRVGEPFLEGFQILEAQPRSPAHCADGVLHHFHRILISSRIKSDRPRIRLPPPVMWMPLV